MTVICILNQSNNVCVDNYEKFYEAGLRIICGRQMELLYHCLFNLWSADPL